MNLPDDDWNRLVIVLQRMVDESRELEEFDARKWLCTWLHEAVPLLGWKKPVVYFDTTEGRHW
ncbi:hypothetical protein [Burkholderia vietnamiensis]|uniref:hypothetical protein n=1 Tax=Burkholderia vietnamiensis TaxID=60552 RepID=UPI002011569A|nr:hypothetical protein [Burkholderia vietnamiensis]